MIQVENIKSSPVNLIDVGLLFNNDRYRSFFDPVPSQWLYKGQLLRYTVTLEGLQRHGVTWNFRYSKIESGRYFKWDIPEEIKQKLNG